MDRDGRGLVAPMVRSVHFKVEVALEVGKLVARGAPSAVRVTRIREQSIDGE
jgi:hypothetical protein